MVLQKLNYHDDITIVNFSFDDAKLITIKLVMLGESFVIFSLLFTVKEYRIMLYIVLCKLCSFQVMHSYGFKCNMFALNKLKVF